MIGRCVDVSLSGVRIVIPNSLEPGLIVTVGVPWAKLNATAEVRHCRAVGDKFTVGFKFRERIEDGRGSVSNPRRSSAR
jgi:hypothetical protein